MTRRLDELDVDELVDVLDVLDEIRGVDDSIAIITAFRDRLARDLVLSAAHR